MNVEKALIQSCPFSWVAVVGYFLRKWDFLNDRFLQWLADCQCLTSGGGIAIAGCPDTHTSLYQSFSAGITVHSHPRARLKSQLFSGEMMCVMMK